MKNWTNAEIVELDINQTASGLFNSHFEAWPLLDKQDQKPATPSTPSDDDDDDKTENQHS